MISVEENTQNLSERLLLIRNTIKQAREGYIELDHQSARTLQALIDESYEDALILEARLSLSDRSLPARLNGKVIQFPQSPSSTKLQLVTDHEPDGAA